MGANDGPAAPSLAPNATNIARARLQSAIDRLSEEPHRFEFHQAVRLLEQWFKALPAHEQPRLQFRNHLSLSFPASEIAQIHWKECAPEERSQHEELPSASEACSGADTAAPPSSPTWERIELTPAFMGFLGTSGTLPLVYTEQFLIREQAQRSDAARAFLDIFQHRAVSLFHEAWRKHRLPLQFERSPDAEFKPLALSFAGLGLPGLSRRLQAKRGGMADDAVAFYAGAFQQRVLGARQLQQIISDYFGVPVKLTQFVGRWLNLEADHCTALGMANATLGRDALAGDRVWQRDLRVRLSLGPMTRKQQSRFLPGQPGALALRELLTLATGISLEYEVRLSLLASEVQPSQLAANDDESAPRLGWNTFLLSDQSPVDREESAYDIHAAA